MMECKAKYFNLDEMYLLRAVLLVLLTSCVNNVVNSGFTIVQCEISIYVYYLKNK